MGCSDDRTEQEKEAAANDRAEHGTRPVGRYAPPPGPIDWSVVDDDDVHAPPTRLSELDKLNGLFKPATVINESPGMQFVDLFNAMSTAADDIALHYTDTWNEISKQLDAAVSKFSQVFGGTPDDQFKGETAEAATNNVRSSLAELTAAAKGAHVMSIIVDAFSRTVSSTHDAVRPYAGEPQKSIDRWPKHEPEIRQGFQSYVAKVINDIWNPAIQNVASKNPIFSGGPLPNVGAPPAPPSGGGISPGGGGGGGAPSAPGGGSGSPAPFKPPDTSEWASALPKAGSGDPSQQGSQGMPEIPTDAAKAPADAAGQAAGAMGDAAKDAMGQATDALGQALNSASQPPGGLPEGVLGLGPNGLNGPKSGPGGGGPKVGSGAGGSGGGSPTGLREPSRAAGAPVSAMKGAETAASASRAGVSGSAGASGAGGAPAAGHRGGSDGKEHKAAKFLRRRQNGEDVLGDADAVVAVVGDGSSADADARPSNQT